MLNTLLATKKDMSQTFVEGVRLPVTELSVGPCVVTQIKTKEKDGYWAVQLGFGTKNIKKISKPLKGHLKKTQNLKNSKTPKSNNSKTKNQTHFPRHIREVRLTKEPKVKVGDEIKVTDIFSVGNIIQVTGTSKGKGFAGVMKRWGFAGGPRTHGQSDRQRAPGSIGQGTDPGRVWKGKKMPGRMGTDTVTVKNLVVVQVDKDKGTILVSGPVPGNRESLLFVSKTGKGGIEKLVKESASQQVAEGGKRAKLAIDKKSEEKEGESNNED